MRPHKDRCRCCACGLLKRLSTMAQVSKTDADEQADDFCGIVGISQDVRDGCRRSDRDTRVLIRWCAEQLDIAAAVLRRLQDTPAAR